jgi:hypothetical protein
MRIKSIGTEFEITHCCEGTPAVSITLWNCDNEGMMHNFTPESARRFAQELLDAADDAEQG